MKRLASLLICLALTQSAWPQAPAEALDLVLPGAKEHLRFEIVIQGESPTAKWNAFLDRWFDFYDVDGDGLLDKREAARIFPMPLPGNQSAAFDFAKADANADGKITRAELKAYYRAAGFTPVLASAEPASLENLQIAEAIFRHFGPDRDGKLTLDRFKRASELLRKLDENEDELLTPTEILSLGRDATLKAPMRSDFAWRQAELKPALGTIKLMHDVSAKQQLRIDVAGKALQPIPAAAGDGALRVRHEQALLALCVSNTNPAKAVATSRQFVLAQFVSVAGSAKAIDKKQVQDDASLQLLADIFPYADRDQNGKLTRAESEQFLRLIEQGVSCPLLVTLTEHGRNLFLHLDTNADGRLDLRELNAAARQVTVLGGANGWTRSQVPHCVQITFQHGFADGAFGPLPLANSSSNAKPPPAARSKKGPAWFQAMDKNGDGFLSPREFLGPIEVFRQLDRDGDGFISAEEAEQEGSWAGKRP